MGETPSEQNRSAYPPTADIGTDIDLRRFGYGLMRRSKQHRYSMASSVRASSVGGTSIARHRAYDLVVPLGSRRLGSLRTVGTERLLINGKRAL